MAGNIIQMVITMIIPTGVLVYTISFGRWMKRRGQHLGFISALFIGVFSYVTSGIVMWRLFT